MEKGKIEHTYWAPYVNIDLRQYGISVADSQRFLDPCETSLAARSKEKLLFAQASTNLASCICYLKCRSPGKCHTAVFAATKGALKSRRKGVKMT